MKKSIYFYLMILAFFGSGLSFLWSAIEFLIYLFKDLKFNWESVWSFIWCIVLVFVFLFLDVVSTVDSVGTTTRQNIPPKKKSAFQERLDRMAKEKGYK